MWRARPPDRVEVRKLHRARERFDLHPLAIHVNYLINLASLDPVIRARSIDAFRGELERAAAIGAEFLVLHPGSYRGGTVEEGIAAFALGLSEASRGSAARGVTILIENTAGAGNHLGSRFEELAEMRRLAGEIVDHRVGFCLDTCHLLAAGFNIATPQGLRGMLQHAARTLGMANVHVLHANDSKGALGSHVDRHANIGEGHIGGEAFHRILTHPKLRAKPFILETPVEEECDDRRNMDTLRFLARRT
jgi:deoxyribonuclease-4